ncbi:hypothetical protein [Bradyrhizobium lablabi]|uniref:hypothetical protein n=1 Tax=Bradyrhizobium lablabi TaxID=722472 RepID=UPI001BAA0997|nr:hypothetical protein [Bradyrhizobium lablabi]MBR0693281.1 hypothetical protein [Bradyrhizobium lablabi]
MSNSEKHDFDALLTERSLSKIESFQLDMWDAAIRVCPKWRGYWPGGDTLIEWLYNERPEIARSIERKHRLFPENDVDVPLSYNHNFGT